MKKKDKIRMFIFALLLTHLPLLFLPPEIVAATYYIDYLAGKDSNNGKSKSTPWKAHPYMRCWTGGNKYLHSAGDRFIFRGGVSWPPSCLPLRLSDGGTSFTSDYYGIDVSWFTGANSGTVIVNGNTVTWASGNAFQMNGSWNGGSILLNGTTCTISAVNSPAQLTRSGCVLTTHGTVPYRNLLFVRPVFDGGGVSSQLIVALSGVSYVTFDSLELTGEMMTSSSGGNASFYSSGATNGNLLLENLDIHNWNRCTGAGSPTSICTQAVTDNSGGGGGVYNSTYRGISISATIVRNSNIGNPEGGGNIGGCTRGVEQVTGNYLHDCSSACVHGCRIVSENVVKNVGLTFDGKTHCNVFYSDQFGNAPHLKAYIYNNLIINTGHSAASTILYPNPGTSGASSSVEYYIFNNVVWGGTNIPVYVDGYRQPPGLSMNVYAYNNTLEVSNAGGMCIATVRRPGVSYGVVDIENNHCIYDGSTPIGLNNVKQPISGHQIVMTHSAATVQGYTTSKNYMPTTLTSATVGTAVNLSDKCNLLPALCFDSSLGGQRAGTPRPNHGLWSSGAYHFPLTPAPPLE